LGEARSTAPVLGRPVHADPAVLGHPSLPVPPPDELLLLALGFLSGVIRSEPGAELVTERGLSCAEREIHPLHPARTAAPLAEAAGGCETQDSLRFLSAQ